LIVLPLQEVAVALHLLRYLALVVVAVAVALVLTQLVRREQQGREIVAAQAQTLPVKAAAAAVAQVQ
jgi:hypothetical protein